MVGNNPDLFPKSPSILKVILCSYAVKNNLKYSINAQNGKVMHMVKLKKYLSRLLDFFHKCKFPYNLIEYYLLSFFSESLLTDPPNQLLNFCDEKEVYAGSSRKKKNASPVSQFFPQP